MLGEEYIDRGQDKGPEAAKLYPRTQTEGVVREGLDTGTGTNYSPGGSHMFHKSQYGSDELLGMETKVSSVREWKYKKEIHYRRQIFTCKLVFAPISTVFKHWF